MSRKLFQTLFLPLTAGEVGTPVFVLSQAETVDCVLNLQDHGLICDCDVCHSPMPMPVSSRTLLLPTVGTTYQMQEPNAGHSLWPE